MKPKEIPLEEGKFYHVYNRGNNRDNLFYKKENYNYFLRKYDEYLSDYIETYAYCLLPNHFHLLISVKEQAKIPPFQKVESFRKVESLVSLQFRKFFTCYSMSINKQEGRVGSLFQKNYKRIQITTSNYLTNLVFYIHANPQLHGLTDDFRMYPWSSYNGILLNAPSKLKKENVLEWFNDKDNYAKYHAEKANINLIKNLIREE